MKKTITYVAFSAITLLLLLISTVNLNLVSNN